MTEPGAAVTHYTGIPGQLEPFEWALYEERLTSFLMVNHVLDNDKVHAFLA